MKDLLSKRIQKAVKDKVFPGCVVGVVRKSGERSVLPFGKFTYEEDSNIVQENTIYDVASITKAIPTSSLLLTLIDQKKTGLEDRVLDYLPEFSNFDNKKDVLIKHLLTYTLNLVAPSMASLKNLSPEQIIKIIVEAPLRNAPGSSLLYTNSTAVFMGLLIERVSGKKIDELADKHFFTPLKMHNTSFQTEKFNKDDIVPTEIDEWRGRRIQGEVHDESTFILQQKYHTGLAGLFSTAPDILSFLEILLNYGTHGGRRFFSPDVVRQMHTNQIADIGKSAGLGWELNQPHFMGCYCTEDTFGKTGFTGCMVLCDIVKEVGIVLLSNRTYPKRPKSSVLINTTRRDIADIIFDNL